MEPAKSVAVGVIRPWERRLGISVAVIAAIFILAAIALPTFDGPHMRQAANEASTVGTLSMLNDLQSRYAKTFQSKGFACDLPDLHPIEASSEVYDRWGYLSEPSHKRSGYTYAIRDCSRNSEGRVDRFAFVAVPTQPGESGFRAFCSDESGVIYQDESGSIEGCLTREHPLN